jgi:hypothetical protein
VPPPGLRMGRSPSRRIWRSRRRSSFPLAPGMATSPATPWRPPRAARRPRAPPKSSARSAGAGSAAAGSIALAGNEEGAAAARRNRAVLTVMADRPKAREAPVSDGRPRERLTRPWANSEEE